MGQASHPTPPYVSDDGSVQPHPIELSQRRMLSLVHQKSSELACPFFFSFRSFVEHGSTMGESSPPHVKLL